jgi:hypothetical protein
MKKEQLTIKISIEKNGYCNVEIKNNDLVSSVGANTPMQLLGLLFREIITDVKLKRKINNWIVRIDKDHSEVIDELMYEKFEEVADFATNVKKSLYK